jgi:hypothetical protein
MFNQPSWIRGAAMALVAAFLLAACATQGPDIRVNSAPDATLGSYGTFGFPEQTGTDRGGYSTIVTNHFKMAVRDQMQLRGYQYVDENPDLLINFFANVRERTEVRSRPGSSFGYYGYRYGLYDAWPLYNNEVETVTYPIGTANIDVVDNKRKQLIWEGVAEGRMREADMENPQETITRIVGQLFERFPGRASAVENTRAAASAQP